MFNINDVFLLISRLAEASDWLDDSADAISVIKIIVEYLIRMVVVFGVIYVIVLSVNYSKAESGDEKAKAQRKIVNTVIGFVSFLVVIILLYIYIEYMPTINNWVRDNIRQIFPSSVSSGGSGT